MGHLHIVSSLQDGSRSRGHSFLQDRPPPPVLVPQELFGPRPSEATIVLLSQAVGSERVILARRIVSRYRGYRPAPNTPDERITVETAAALFRCVVAMRASMKFRRHKDDLTALSELQRAMTDCVTRENARDVATMMHCIGIGDIRGTITERRPAARALMTRVLAQGFVVVTPEVRAMANDVLVIATAFRPDSLGAWATVTNMKLPLGTIVPPKALVLVPCPLPRPLGWEPQPKKDARDVREVTYITGDTPVFIDPSFVR